MKLPEEIKKLVPPDAQLVKQTKTKLGTTYVFKHVVDGWEVDGDRRTVKLTPSSPPQVKVVLDSWHEVIPPFPVPPVPAKAIPILINPKNPLYSFAQKPPLYHPCFLLPDFRIQDAQSKEIIGKVLEPPK